MFYGALKYRKIAIISTDQLVNNLTTYNNNLLNPWNKRLYINVHSRHHICAASDSPGHKACNEPTIA